MKKTVNVIIILALFAILFSCGNKSKVNKTAKGFLTELYKMNYDSAKHYCTEESYGYLDFRKLLDNYINTEKAPNFDKLNIEINEIKIDGNNAECKYKVTGLNDMTDEEETLNLIFKDNKWLVDLHAENLNFNKDFQKDSIPALDTTVVDSE